MPVQPKSVMSESLLPDVDYPSEPVRSSRPGPDLKLIAGSAATPRSETPRSESSAAAPAEAARMPPAQPATVTEAFADERSLASLRLLTEEEIVALFG